MSHPTPTDPETPSAPLAGEDAVKLDAHAGPEGDLPAAASELDSEGLPKANPESAFAEATRQLEDVMRREAELLDSQKRLAADFANFRNRTQRDIAMAVEQAERKLLLELLPVLDNFDRGLGATYPDVEAFRGGVELIRKQFQDALRRLNVEPMALKVGDPFDALQAEALTTFEDPNLPDGAIAAIFEPGFTLRGQLLRAARVVVNRHPDAEKA